MLALGALPAIVLAGVLVGTAHAGRLGVDFSGGVLPGARALLDGRSPYDAGHAHAVLAGMRNRYDVPFIEAVACPPTMLLAAVPLGLVPLGAAVAAFVAAMAAVPLASLRMLGVRDWRCYGATYLSLPVVHTIALGNASGLVLLALAACWRWRDRTWWCAAAVVAPAAIKLAYPTLVVWLAASRRWREAMCAALAAGALCALSVATVGLDGIEAFASVARDLARVQGASSYSLTGLASMAHLAGAAAPLTIAATAVLLLAACRRAGCARDEAGAFALVVLAGLALLPLVHQLYFAALLVPIALASRRFTWRWLVLLPFWLFPYEAVSGRALGMVVAAVVVAGYLFATARPHGCGTSG